MVRRNWKQSFSSWNPHPARGIRGTAAASVLCDFPARESTGLGSENTAWEGKGRGRSVGSAGARGVCSIPLLAAPALAGAAGMGTEWDRGELGAVCPSVHPRAATCAIRRLLIGIIPSEQLIRVRTVTPGVPQGAPLSPAPGWGHWDPSRHSHFSREKPQGITKWR